MDNISTNLLRFNGEIGPQYLDPDDKTGGPDGTMKPITKDVLREMIMLNLPEIQKVQDEYVKAELESIKQTQQQILQRLNQPINTQLTGSYVANVELIYEERDITVNAGTIKQVGSIFNVSQYNYVFVHLEMSILGRCKVYERPSRGTFSGSALTQRVLVDRSNTSANAYSDYFPVISLYTRFFIENTMQNDFTYGGLYIFGVKA